MNEKSRGFVVLKAAGIVFKAVIKVLNNRAMIVVHKPDITN